MGKVVSVVWKPFRDFNLESRAHKVISQDKPVPAPKHKADKLKYEQLQPQDKSMLEKDKKLDQFLKDVYVSSHDPSPQPPPVSSSAERPKPLDRAAVAESEFGYREPEKVPYGRTTLKKALEFISNHQTDGLKHPVSKIAEDYKLSEEIVGNILKYFRVYEIYIPADTKSKAKATFAGPLVKRKLVFTHKAKELPPGSGEKDS